MADWQLEQRRQRGEHVVDQADEEAKRGALNTLKSLKSFVIGDTPSEMAFNAATVGAMPLKALRPTLMGLSALTASDDAEASFGGLKSATANLAKLAKAKLLAAQGAARGDIWRETGWGKAPGQDKWVYEIDDSKARLRPDFDNLRQSQIVSDMPLGGVLEHSELQRAYPQLFRNTRVTELKRGTLEQGKFSAGSPARIEVTAPSAEDAKRLLLHEAGGHGVADIENMAKGTTESQMRGVINNAQRNFDKFTGMSDEASEALQRAKASGIDPQTGKTLEELMDMQVGAFDQAKAHATTLLKQGTDPFKAYQNEPGEQLSRIIEQRMNHTPEQRSAEFPFNDATEPYAPGHEDMAYPGFF